MIKNFKEDEKNPAEAGLFKLLQVSGSDTRPVAALNGAAALRLFTGYRPHTEPSLDGARQRHLRLQLGYLRDRLLRQ